MKVVPKRVLGAGNAQSRTPKPVAEDSSLPYRAQQCGRPEVDEVHIQKVRCRLLTAVNDDVHRVNTVVANADLVEGQDGVHQLILEKKYSGIKQRLAQGNIRNHVISACV